MSEAQTTSTAAFVFIAATVVALAGWTLWGGLRHSKYFPHAFFGVVPESRPDGREHRLYLTRLRGVCAIEGAKMRPRRRLVHSEDRPTRDGGIQKVRNYELQMVCTRNPSDERHRGRIDLTDTEEWRGKWVSASSPI